MSDNITITLSTTSPEIADLIKALVKVQGSLKPVEKNAINPFFKSKYADLTAIWENCRKELSSNGLAVIQTTKGNGDSLITVVTTLAHISGQWIRGDLTMRPVKNDPQGVGSARTYARRYGLQAILGIAAEEDDDGEVGTRRGKGEGNLTQGKQDSSKDTTTSNRSGDGDGKQATTKQVAKIWACINELAGLSNMTSLEMKAQVLKQHKIEHIDVSMSVKKASEIIDGLTESIKNMKDNGD